MRRLIGHISIDSGLCLVGDPGYLVTEQPAWEAFLDRLPEKRRRAWALPHDKNPKAGFSQAVVTGTGDGDGIYPVYVEFDSEGRVRKIIVEFT
jgi:hypothetical protein